MLLPQIGPSNPFLRKHSDPVVFISPDMPTLFAQMREVMQAHKGVGISAPQVGINKQIILITTRTKKKNKDTCTGEIIMLNPSLVQHNEDICLSEEGCVSLPGIFGKVPRYKKITVSYMDYKGVQQKKTYTDFTAYIIQHEIDHLDGILFVDKMIEEIKK